MTVDRELLDILETFVASGWDELAVPARRFLEGKVPAAALREVILCAQAACGTCGCALDALYPRYGYPNDMLLRLAEQGARLAQPTVRPVYADEISGLRISRVIAPISGILLRGALRRIQR